MPIISKRIYILLIGVIILLPCFVVAQDKYGLTETARKTRLINLSISKSNPEALIAQVITLILGFVATIFFVLVLYGGITWMTAMGSDEKISKAKNILQTSIIGLIIVAASYAISTFIFDRLTTSQSGSNTCSGICLPVDMECPGGVGTGQGACPVGERCCAT